MRALSGLTKAETLRLAEIEHFVANGTRPDGLHATDDWIAETLLFLVSKLRPTIEAKQAIAAREEAYSLVTIEAKKVWRLWNKGVTGEPLNAVFRTLGRHLQNADHVLEKTA